MQNETVARRYAVAVFSLAKDGGAVDAVGRDLHVVADAIVADPDALRFFVSPVIDREEKAKVIARVFEAKVGEIVLHTLLLLVRKRREALLRAIVAEYDKLQLAGKGLEPLEIVSAREMPPAEVDVVVQRLARAYGKTFKVTRRVDPSLLGGVRITMGDDVRIDGSIAGRLDELARDLSTNAREARGAPLGTTESTQ
jgi:F-type H+-transporting ATPase subunit delta